jgi:hypothetical protein
VRPRPGALSWILGSGGGVLGTAVDGNSRRDHYESVSGAGLGEALRFSRRHASSREMRRDERRGTREITSNVSFDYSLIGGIEA